MHLCICNLYKQELKYINYVNVKLYWKSNFSMRPDTDYILISIIYYYILLLFIPDVVLFLISKFNLWYFWIHLSFNVFICYIQLYELIRIRSLKIIFSNIAEDCAKIFYLYNIYFNERIANKLLFAIFSQQFIISNF